MRYLVFSRYKIALFFCIVKLSHKKRGVHKMDTLNVKSFGFMFINISYFFKKRQSRGLPSTKYITKNEAKLPIFCGKISHSNNLTYYFHLMKPHYYFYIKNRAASRTTLKGKRKVRFLRKIILITKQVGFSSTSNITYYF